MTKKTAWLVEFHQQGVSGGLVHFWTKKAAFAAAANHWGGCATVLQGQFATANGVTVATGKVFTRAVFN